MAKKHAAFSRELAALLKFVRFTNKFRSIERLIWFKGVEGRERNGEHVFQLAFVAWYVWHNHLRHLHLLKVFTYVLVHDIPEIYAGDTPAFTGKNGSEFASTLTHKDKKEREREALERIEKEWENLFPDLAFWIKKYEAQTDEESRFVYALDKFLAELNIYEDGGRTDKLLGLVLEDKIPYKRSRIASHPLIARFYDELCAFCETRPELYFQPKDSKQKQTAT